jgi:branched-chain amino acid transport system substrate-binding protein
MKLFAGLVAAVTTAALAAGCANTDDAANGPSSGGDDSGPLKIGVIVPLSGAAGPNGKHVLQAIEAEAEKLNQDGGVDGRQIEVVSRDDKSTPATGVSAATDLVSEGVDVVMGGWNSPVTLAIQPILVRSNVLNITSIPQSSEIIGGVDDAAIRMNAGNKVGGYVAANYLTQELGAKRVGLMLENDAYGTDAGDFVTQNLPSDAEVVTKQLFDYTATDFRVAISSLKAAKPDAVFSADAAESSGQPALMKQLSEADLGIPYFAGVGTVSQTVIDLAGAGANGSYSADLYFPEAEPWASNPANQAFMKAFQEKAGQLPDKFAALGAESVDVWAQAVESAGTSDREKVADAIKGQTFSDTVLGDVSFTDQGQMISEMYAFTVENERVKVLDKVDVPDETWQQ